MCVSVFHCSSLLLIPKYISDAHTHPLVLLSLSGPAIHSLLLGNAFLHLNSIPDPQSPNVDISTFINTISSTSVKKKKNLVESPQGYKYMPFTHPTSDISSYHLKKKKKKERHSLVSVMINHSD